MTSICWEVYHWNHAWELLDVLDNKIILTEVDVWLVDSKSHQGFIIDVILINNYFKLRLIIDIAYIFSVWLKIFNRNNMILTIIYVGLP